MQYCNNQIITLSKHLAQKGTQEAAYHPIDRAFLLDYLDEILSLDKADFIRFNFDYEYQTYVELFFASLPELWEGIDVDDVIDIFEGFSTPAGYQNLVLFTYKYLEVNFIDLIFHSESVTTAHKEELRKWLDWQWISLLKDESDYFLSEKDVFANLDVWKIIKQQFLIDARIEPAITDESELKEYISSICS